MHAEAIGDLALVVFYYLLCIDEYTVKGKLNNTKQTVQFKLKDVTIHHKWSNVTWRQLLIEEGVTQGYPLSPIFASFLVACLLEPIDALLCAQAVEQLASGNPGDDKYGGITHLLSYVNGISTCIYLPDLEFFCNTLKTNGADLGCFLNMTKTMILTSCNVTSHFLSSPPPIPN